MGSSLSCEVSDQEKNTYTKSGSYVEELLQIKHANFLNSHSLESKEALQSRRERILKALTERKPVKPYAIQLLEARAAASSEISSITDKIQELTSNADAQSNNLQNQKKTKGPDQKSRILQRIAAGRKSKRILNTPQDSTVNTLPSSVVNTSPIGTPAITISPSPSIYTLTPLASNKATQSDPPAKVTLLSTASQSLSISSVDSAIQVSPMVQSSPQQTVRLSEPKIYVQPPTPPQPKIFTPPQTKIFTPPSPRLSTQPPMSLRQSISAAFSRPIPPSPVVSIAPSPPSFSDRLENVCKEKLNQTKLSNWKNESLMEEKIHGNKNPVPLISSPMKSSSINKLTTLNKENGDTYLKRHTAEVDRLTDSLIANWAKKNTSAELQGAKEKELSLLTYGESKSTMVPHFPVRREKDRICTRYGNHGDALVLKDSLPSVCFGKTRPSLISCERRREQRCMRHRENKI